MSCFPLCFKTRKVETKVPIDTTLKIPRAALEFTSRQMDYFLIYFGQEIGIETVDWIRNEIKLKIESESVSEIELYSIGKGFRQIVHTYARRARCKFRLILLLSITLFSSTSGKVDIITIPNIFGIFFQLNP